MAEYTLVSSEIEAIQLTRSMTIEGANQTLRGIIGDWLVKDLASGEMRFVSNVEFTAGAALSDMAEIAQMLKDGFSEADEYTDNSLTLAEAQTIISTLTQSQFNKINLALDGQMTLAEIDTFITNCT